MTILNASEENGYTQGLVLAIIIIVFVLFSIIGVYYVVSPIIVSALATVQSHFPY